MPQSFNNPLPEPLSERQESARQEHHNPYPSKSSFLKSMAKDVIMGPEHLPEKSTDPDKKEVAMNIKTKKEPVDKEKEVESIDKISRQKLIREFKKAYEVTDMREAEREKLGKELPAKSRIDVKVKDLEKFTEKIKYKDDPELKRKKRFIDKMKAKLFK